MTQRLKVHDHVSWKTPQGTTRGHVVRVITRRTEFAGQSFAASKDDPHYEVESEKTGKHAIHRADGLHKLAH